MLSPAERRLLAALWPAASVRGAALTLGIPRATVSRRLLALEARLGQNVFLRRGRALVATREGAALLTRAARAEAADHELRAALAELTGGAQRRLTVAASPLFAELVLPGALASLDARWPELRVDVRLSHELAELHAGQIDVAFRRGPLESASSLRARKIGRTTMVCIGAAAWGAAPPTSLEAHAAALSWVRVGTRPEPLTLRWREGRRPRRVVLTPFVTVDSQRVALELARRGLGVARVNAFLVRAELEQGTLIDVLPAARTVEDVYAVYPERTPPDPLVRALVLGAREQAAAVSMWDA